MVQHSHGDSGKYLNREWHEIRWQAESETFGINEWDDIDVFRYDLDEVDFSRKFKQSTYEPQPRLESEGSAKGSTIRTLGESRE